MKNFREKNKKGVIIIIAFFTLGILTLLGFYFLSFALTEFRISKNQEVSTRAYYLTEAGINEAIWKLKNDPVWKDSFAAEPGCVNWSADFTRNYTLNSTTTISIQNFRCAKGEIAATSTVKMAGNKTVQRALKVKVFKALGSLSEDSPVFSGAPSGETTIQSSLMNVYNGNIFSNNNLNIKLGSIVNVYDNPDTDAQEGQVLNVQNINISKSVLNASSTCAKNCCTAEICEKCPVNRINMPGIDFDSEEPGSYKNKAQKAQDQGQCGVRGEDFLGNLIVSSDKCIFTENEFENFLWDIGKKGTLFLEYKTNGQVSSVYYVIGGIDLKGERGIEINGVLIAEETINIGEKSKWAGDSGLNQLTIIDPGQGIASGLLTKGKMNFGAHTCFEEVNISGLIYSLDEMRLVSIPCVFNVEGGIIARKFSLTSVQSGLNIYLNNDIIREGIWGGPEPPGEEKPPYSQVVVVEHWEESY